MKMDIFFSSICFFITFSLELRYFSPIECTYTMKLTKFIILCDFMHISSSSLKHNKHDFSYS